MANDHYITQAYLRKFFHPTSVQNVLFKYTKGTGLAYRNGNSTRSLGSFNDFYVQTEGDARHDTLDKARQKVETILFAQGENQSALTRCVCDDNFEPTNEDKELLSFAASFLRCGAPVQIHNAAMTGLLAHQLYAFNQMNSQETRDSYQREFGVDFEAKIQEDKDELYDGRLILDVGEENWRQFGFESMNHIEFHTKAMSIMGLTICHAHYNSFFITSDNPVVLTSNSQPDRPGLGLSDIEIWFPISYNKGLLWTRKHMGIKKDYFGHSRTRMINRSIIKWCYKEIYSPLKDHWIDDATINEDYDPCWGHYGSLKEVIENHSHPAINSNGEPTEIVNLMDGLRAGRRLDVVRINTPQ